MDVSLYTDVRVSTEYVPSMHTYLFVRRSRQIGSVTRKLMWPVLLRISEAHDNIASAGAENHEADSRLIYILEKAQRQPQAR